MKPTSNEEANKLAHVVARLALAYSKSKSNSVMFCWLDLKEALDEYERKVSMGDQK